MKTTATNPNYDCLRSILSWDGFLLTKKRNLYLRVLNTLMMIIVLQQWQRRWARPVLSPRQEPVSSFMKRALSYKNLIDPETKYMRGRDSQGNWRSPFSPIAYQGPGSVNGWGILQKGLLYSTLVCAS